MSVLLGETPLVPTEGSTRLLPNSLVPFLSRHFKIISTHSDAFSGLLVSNPEHTKVEGWSQFFLLYVRKNGRTDLHPSFLSPFVPRTFDSRQFIVFNSVIILVVWYILRVQYVSTTHILITLLIYNSLVKTFILPLFIKFHGFWKLTLRHSYFISSTITDTTVLYFSGGKDYLQLLYTNATMCLRNPRTGRINRV